MKSFLLLTKIQLKGDLNLKKMFRVREGKNRSGVTGIVLTVFLLVLFAGLSGVYAYLYAGILKPMNALSVLLSLWMAATSVILLITTISKVKGTLFAFNDYDMVMSMPVSTAAIVASRIIVLYLYDLLFTAIFMAPANVVYGVFSNQGAGFYLLSTMLLLFVPFVPILIGSFIGLILTVISSRFRHSNVVALVLFLGIYIAYMIVMMNPNISDDAMIDFGNMLSEQVNGVYPLTKLYSDAIAGGNVGAILSFLGISTLVFLVFCMIVGKWFKKLNTLVSSSKARSNYKMKELKTSSRLGSLYKKELKRYFASPAYVMNSAIGMIMLTVLSVVLLVTGEEKFSQMLEVPGVAEQLAGYVPIALLFCVMMTCTTSSSISLEGKNLWLMKSFPIPAIQVFLGKVLLNLTITLPLVVINTVIYAVVLHMSVVQVAVSIVLSITGAIFIALFGLMINLKFPRFDWKSETEIVKQSMATMITLFLGMALGIAPVGLMILLPQIAANVLYLIYAGGLLLASIGMYGYLKRGGSRRFYQL